MKYAKAVGLTLAFLAGSSSVVHAQLAKDDYTGYEEKELIPGGPIGSVDITGPAQFSMPSGRGPSLVTSFAGLSQYDVAAFARNFIPPDTMGAAGKTQLMEFVNGGVAVFDKSNGATISKMSDLAFWAAAGQSGANGDSRVMYNAAANRWIATSFSASVSQIQIAVSDTSDATGGWKSTIFTGFSGGTADYPTLALDKNAVYIGTNNFDGAGSFAGTTLNVIPLSSLFNAVSPTTSGRAVVNTPYDPVLGGHDGGFAIQGVNSTDASTTGHIVAASLFYDDVLRYDITNAGMVGQAKTPTQYIGIADYASNGPGRQPNVVPDVAPNATFSNNNRVIDTLDQRIGSSTYLVNGRIYAVYTVTPLGSDYTYVRYDVYDAKTNALLDEGLIGDGAHDFYEGSLAVNSRGTVVIGYNRSGSDPLDGNISVLARVFTTGADGVLSQHGADFLLAVSSVDDYHNGSIDGRVAAGRQRWGDYSAVSLDPTNQAAFWVFGEYATNYNDAAGGHPGGSGGSRWATAISEIDTGGIPEPSVWGLLIAGFGMTGAAVRRRRRAAANA